MHREDMHDRLYLWTGPFVFLMVALRESARWSPFPHPEYRRTQALLVHVTTAFYILTAANLFLARPVESLLGDGLFWTTWTFALFQILHHTHDGNRTAAGLRIGILLIVGLLRCIHYFSSDSMILSIIYLLAITNLLTEILYGSEDNHDYKLVPARTDPYNPLAPASA